MSKLENDFIKVVDRLKNAKEAPSDGVALTGDELEKMAQEYIDTHTQADFKDKWIISEDGTPGVFLDHHPCSDPKYPDCRIFIPKDKFKE